MFGLLLGALLIQLVIGFCTRDPPKGAQDSPFVATLLCPSSQFVHLLGISFGSNETSIKGFMGKSVYSSDYADRYGSYLYYGYAQIKSQDKLKEISYYTPHTDCVDIGEMYFNFSTFSLSIEGTDSRKKIWILIKGLRCVSSIPTFAPTTAVPTSMVRSPTPFPAKQTPAPTVLQSAENIASSVLPNIVKELIQKDESFKAISNYTMVQRMLHASNRLNHLTVN
jgi:hypothetical protein